MASEQFSLCWDNFHKNMSSGMNSLLENEDLVDVTLAVEGRYLKAHKLVLSVCSPYFKELFKVNPCKHPIVFMKDVSYVALSDLLQFMYQGEVQVSQDNLTTFIKTAEALQVKGLTGDGNGSADSDIAESVSEEKPHSVEDYIPTNRVKKHVAPPLPTHGTKRPRMSSDVHSISNVKAISTKSESGNTNLSSNADLVQFKMEPYDQSQSISIPDDGPDDHFGDNLDDTAVDDGEEDYSMMESAEEEPKAGTSTDAVGESQDKLKDYQKPRKRITTRTRFIVDGFIYHNNVISGTPPQRYLGCADHRRVGCRGRATIPVGADLSQLKLTQLHNHPPDLTAAEKDTFIKELRKAVLSQSLSKISLRIIYDNIADLYPKGAAQISYRSINSSLHRWRRAAQRADKESDHLISIAQRILPGRMCIKGYSYSTSYIKDAESKDVVKRKQNMPRYIVDGFVFHVNITKGNPPMIYLRCLEYKRLGCHARAIIPYDGSIQDIKVNKPHNHPPEIAAEEKIVFLRELKDVMLSNPLVSSRSIYKSLAEMYPNAARETPFESIRHKMNRWRRQLD